MSEPQSLGEYAAGEIRAMLARRRITGRELATKLGVSRSWVSYRLTGTTEITLNDLGRIASALGVSPVDLIPATADSTRPASSRYPASGGAPRSARLLVGAGHAPTQSEPRRPQRIG